MGIHTDGRRGAQMEWRAMSDEDKRRKRDLILSTALELFKRERRFQTAAKIASTAELAKGTLYLYFASKEEIYLELLLQTFSEWHGHLRQYISTQRPDAAGLITYMCRSLLDYSTFVELASLAVILLEQNLSSEVQEALRRRLHEQRVESSRLIARLYPEWTEEEAHLNLRRFNTYALAYWREYFAPKGEASRGAELRALYFEEIWAMSRLIWGIGKQA